MSVSAIPTMTPRHTVFFPSRNAILSFVVVSMKTTCVSTLFRIPKLPPHPDPKFNSGLQDGFAALIVEVRVVGLEFRQACIWPTWSHLSPKFPTNGNFPTRTEEPCLENPHAHDLVGVVNALCLIARSHCWRCPVNALQKQKDHKRTDFPSG